MGAISSSSSSQRKAPNQNMQFLDKLKSALAINKRDRSIFPTGHANFVNNNQNKNGTYKTLESNQSVDYYAFNIIGRGSFGVVYSAKNTYGQTIAVKCKKQLADHELMKKSTLLFRDELEALYNLEHVNIVKLIGVEFRSREVVSLVMENIVGDTLDKYIKAYRSLNEPIIQLFTKQIIDALAYMHSKYVMHRDMKSSNVMIVGGRLVKLIDFGMAKHFDISDNAVSDYEISTSTVVGTIPYMAPELISFGRYNSKIDIWSVGVIIFEMITGDVFLRTNRPGTPGAGGLSLAQAPSPIRVYQLTEIANQFMQSCLIKNPDYRPTALNLLRHPFIQSCFNPGYVQNPPPPYMNNAYNYARHMVNNYYQVY